MVYLTALKICVSIMNAQIGFYHKKQLYVHTSRTNAGLQKKKKSVDSITVAMVVMMTSYFVFAVGL